MSTPGATVRTAAVKGCLGKLALCGVAAVVALALLEWTSTLVYRHLRDEPFSKQRLQARLAASGMPEDLEVADVALAPFVEEKVLHPYLGFVIDRKQDSRRVNRFGFVGRSPLLPKRQGELLVAVFGGSVAGSIPHRILRQELEKLQPYRDHSIEFVSLAMGGYKQPQQLLALTYFLALGAEFDVVINLDGYNDVVLPFTENLPAHVHPSFPRAWHFYSRKGFDRKAVSIYTAIQQARRGRARRSAWLAASALRSSAFVLSLWDALDRRQQRLISEATAALNNTVKGAVTSFQTSGPMEPDPEFNPLFRETVQLWAESSHQMARLCQANGIQYFHFLQPSQYVEESKPMSQTEQRRALAPGNNRDLVRRGYPMLIEAGRILAREGVRFSDLTRVFESEKRTLYTDTCCHFNALGYEIMLREMARRMASPTPQALASP